MTSKRLNIIILIASLLIYISSEALLRELTTSNIDSSKFKVDTIVSKLPAAVRSAVQEKIDLAQLKDALKQARSPRMKALAITNLANFRTTSKEEKGKLYSSLLNNYPDLYQSNNAYIYFFLKADSSYKISIDDFQKYISKQIPINRYQLWSMGLSKLNNLNISAKIKLKYLMPLMGKKPDFEDYYNLYKSLASLALTLGDTKVYSLATEISEKSLDLPSIEEEMLEKEMAKKGKKFNRTNFRKRKHLKVSKKAKSKLQKANNKPLLLDLKPVKPNEFLLQIKSLTNKKFKGKLEIKFEGENLKYDLDIKKYGFQNIKIITKKDILKVGEIIPLKISGTIKRKKTKIIKVDISISCFLVEKRKADINIDGNIDDWSTVSDLRIRNIYVRKKKLKIGKKEYNHAVFKALWDEDYLYLCVIVKDDKFVRLPTAGRYGWFNDTLQLYLDTFADARLKNNKGFDDNDYNYDFFPKPKRNTSVVFRRTAPKKAVTGGNVDLKINTVEPNIKSAFKTYDWGYIYEIAFPKKYIAPLQLTKGGIAGFAMILNDRDGSKMKYSLTLTPPGTEPHLHPKLYPIMILKD